MMNVLAMHSAGRPLFSRPFNMHSIEDIGFTRPANNACLEKQRTRGHYERAPPNILIQTDISYRFRRRQAAGR